MKFNKTLCVSTLSLLSILAFASCAKDQNDGLTTTSNSEKASLGTPESVTLYSRDVDTEGKAKDPMNPDSYRLSCFSFRYMTQDYDYTGNNWDIHFKRSARGSIGTPKEGMLSFYDDVFETETVVDDFSNIMDIGAGPCKELTDGRGDKDKYKYPGLWAESFVTGAYEHTRGRSARVQEGHCYFVANTDLDGMVMAIFHVRKHVPGVSVTIDEIERLQDKRFK